MNFGIALLLSATILNGNPISQELVNQSNYLQKSFDKEIRVEQLYNIDLELTYTLYCNDENDGFAIFFENDLLEENSEFNPYYGYDKDKYIKFYFADNDENERFFVSDNIKIWNVFNFNETYNLYEFFSYEMNKSNDGEYASDKICSEGDLLVLEHKIDKWEFFYKSTRSYGWNDSNDCGVIAVQIMLNYFDSFISDDYIPERFDRPSISENNSNLWKEWDISPGSGWFRKDENKYNDDQFEEYLCDIAAEFRAEKRGSGMIGVDVGNLLKQYKSKINDDFQSNIDFVSYIQTGGILFGWANLMNFVKEKINCNAPVILGGGSHYAIAYAYDDIYVYLCNGWGYTHKARWNDFYTNTLFADAIYIENKTNHSHSDNYYSSTGRCFYCTCGKKMYDCKSFDLIEPKNNFGFVKDSIALNINKIDNKYIMNVNGINSISSYLGLNINCGKKNSLCMNISSYFKNNNSDFTICIYNRNGTIYEKSIIDYSKIYYAKDDLVIIQFDENVADFEITLSKGDFTAVINDICIGCI